MRIGMVSEAYHPTMNGVVVSIDTFARELRRRGHEVIVFAPHTPRATRETDVVRVASVGLPFNADYRLVLERSGAFTELVRKERLDLLHSHHIFRLGRLAQIAARSLNLPFVQTYHTLMAEYTHHIPLIKWLPFGQRLAKQFIIWRSRTFLSRADQIISPSPSIGKLLRSYGVNQRVPITALPTGIELKEFRQRATDRELAQYGIEPTGRFLLFVGRLGQEKNVLRLLETFALIHQEAPDIQLVLIGDGPERARYEAWLRTHGLTNTAKTGRQPVVLTGFLDKQITNRLFRRAYLFVFASITDTQGIVVQEALISGVPVVAVNQFGPADYNRNGETGYLVPNSAPALARATLKLLNDQELHHQMAVKAQAYGSHFSIEATTDQLLTVYASALKHHP